ncbi:MAG: glycosyltransferase [Clostridiales bacterium]|jgi:teichuronic acid biosynthesis glycosyltransferase TuaG|nr:glycosyltransferase [Clostridiales bacterium]
MDKAKVSVVMPAYNAERTIEESIRSVSAQTYTEWELIVIDDCSTDGTDATVMRLSGADPRVKYYRNGQNSGVAYSRNKGVNLANSEYIAFLDSDDKFSSNKLERQMAFMKIHNAQISYTASAFIDSEGNPFRYILPAVGWLTYYKLLKRNLMSCSSVMVKRDLIVKYPFTNRKNTHEDFVSWLYIVKEVGIAYGLDEPLLTYRLSANSKSANRLASALMNYNAYREVGYSFVISAAFTLRYALHSIQKRRKIYASGN